MKHLFFLNCVLLLLVVCADTYADTYAKNTHEIETTIIRGNKEAPQTLFVVPWQETKKSTKKEEQKLILHSLFGDLFDPVLPADIDRPLSIEKQ